MAELKPCPFCGSKWTDVRYMNNPFDTHHIYGGYASYCDDCCATTKRFKTETEAIEAWERRAVDGKCKTADLQEM